MCYDIEEGYKRRIKEGIRIGADPKDINHHIDEYNRRFPDKPIPRIDGGFHLNGFSHPELPIFRKTETGIELTPMTWGLIPNWCKDAKSATKIWNQTINARSESMFEKPSFRDAANSKRGILLLQSFYEHHHFGKQAYPFNIRLKTDEPMLVAVLCDDWVDPFSSKKRETFSIVTIAGNELMKIVHNNPKLNEPRMPLILTQENAETWLNGNEKQTSEICLPFSATDLTAHSVRKLRGKNAIGDTEKAIEPFEYPELQFDFELQEILS